MPDDMPPDDTAADRERRLDAILGAYLEALDAGMPSDRRQLLDLHPELADALRAFFADYERVRRLAKPLHAAAQGARGETPTEPATALKAEAAPVDPEATAQLQPSPDVTADQSNDLSPEDGNADLPRGSRIRYFGDYELLRVLGRGGMGVVYKARQVSLNRPVALKMIRAGLWAGEDEVRRFRNEAEAIANLDHPRIVTIHEVGEFSGQHYFSMKLVEGPSLAERSEVYAARPREAAKLVSEVARAVHHAHQRGILHRDLKPSNILLDHEGHPHVTDFGLAKRLEGDESLSVSGSIVGTPSYMSPEQASGTKHGITTATDVYGLGALLYATLTGRGPFQSDSVVETLRQVQEKPAEPPSKVNRRVDHDLETICLRCLEKEPRKRYGSADALAEDLERYLRGEPIQARRTGPVERAAKWAKRRPTVAALLGLVGVVGLLGFVGILMQWQETELARRALDRNLYFKLIDLADREWSNRDYAHFEKSLAECPPHLRDWEWRYLRRRSDSEPLVLRGHSGYSFGLAFSPDGRRLATGGAALNRPDKPGELKVWDLAVGSVLLDVRVNGTVLDSVAFSPDGARITVTDWNKASDRPEIKVLDSATGLELLALRGHLKRILSVRYSPDGRYIASGSDDRTVRIWEAMTGRELQVLCGPTKGIFKVEISPDCRQVAALAMDQTLRIWDAANGRELHVVRDPSGLGGNITYSPDGRVIATVSHGLFRRWEAATGREISRIKVGEAVGVAFNPAGTRFVTWPYAGIKFWDTASGGEAFTLRGLRSAQFLVAFSPDGSRLAATHFDGTVLVWDAALVDRVSERKPLRTLLGHAANVFTLAFRPDGKQLASADDDGTLRIWDSVTGRGIHRIRAHSGSVRGIGYSPDSRFLATTGATEGTLKVWDADTGRAVATLLENPGVVITTSYSPDGRSIAVSVEREDRPTEVLILDASTGRQNLTLRGHTNSATVVAFSPDGTRLAAACQDQTARLWDLATGREIVALRGHTDSLQDVAFSPDGQRLATCSADKTARLWDAATGKELLVLRGHAGDLVLSAFSPDGRRLITVSIDKTIRAWDVATGRELGYLILDEFGYTAYSRDGRYFAVCVGETIQLWDATVLTTPPLTFGTTVQSSQAGMDATPGNTLRPPGNDVQIPSDPPGIRRP